MREWLFDSRVTDFLLAFAWMLLAAACFTIVCALVGMRFQFDLKSVAPRSATSRTIVVGAVELGLAMAIMASSAATIFLWRFQLGSGRFLLLLAVSLVAAWGLLPRAAGALFRGGRHQVLFGVHSVYIQSIRSARFGEAPRAFHQPAWALIGTVFGVAMWGISLVQQRGLRLIAGSLVGISVVFVSAIWAWLSGRTVFVYTEVESG